jgi:hypothetical protein
VAPCNLNVDVRASQWRGEGARGDVWEE